MAGKAGMRKKHTIETIREAVAEATNGEYEVLDDSYPGYHTKMKFKHIKCGNEYEISYSNFFQGSRCYNCVQKANGVKALKARKKGYDLEWVKELIEKHGNGEYKMLSTEYHNVHTKVDLLHVKCGKVYQVTTNHFRNGRRCTDCKRVSTGEMHTEMALQELGFKYEKQKTLPGLKRIRSLKLDFWLPDHRIAVEYDGQQHHRKDAKWYSTETVQNDQIKDAYCEENGIQMIRIPHSKQSIKTIVSYLREKASTTIPQGSTLKRVEAHSS